MSSWWSVSLSSCSFSFQAGLISGGSLSPPDPPEWRTGSRRPSNLKATVAMLRQIRAPSGPPGRGVAEEAKE